MTLYRFPAILLALLLVLAGCASDGGEAENFATPSEKAGLRVSNSGTALPLLEKLAEAYSREHPDIEFRFEPGASSDSAVQGLLEGMFVLAVVDRPLTEGEESESLAYAPFARNAVAFVANRTEKVEELTTDQVRDVYAGKLTDWEQLGGSPGPILALDRGDNGPAREQVLVPLMQGRPVEARTIVLDGPSETVEALKSTPDSLGYSSIGLLRDEELEGAEILALDGVTPSPESVARDEYPWSLTSALVYNEDAPPAVRGFVEFVAGPEGRRLVEENGYAPN